MTPAVKLLIAEDDKLNRMMLEKLMKRFSADCVMAKDGQETVDLFETDTFDAVFLDVNMPVYSGPECAEIIRRKCAEQGAEMPLLVCISADDEYMNSEIFDTFLLKPFSIESIKNLVDGILGSKCGKISYSLEKASEIIGLDLETMQMLLGEFIASFEEELAELTKAVAENNAEMITHNAHKMKGASANMQIDILRSLCADMQTVEKTDTDRVARLLMCITSSFESFKRQFSS